MKEATRKTQALMEDNINVYLNEIEWRGVAA
jgi:hypothetical protein